MIKANKQLILKLFIGSLIFGMLFFNSFSRIKNNGSGGGYEEEDDEKVNGMNITIETYISEGGGYYLSANSDIQTILKTIELQDIQSIDFIELNNVLDKAISKMRNAILTYENLIKKAESTPYNEYVLSLLEDFDYTNFMIEKGLNSVVFMEVEGYLKEGDITGIFKNTYNSFTDILEMLNLIKVEISKNNIPELSIFWRLNETLSESSLFGSYVARVFSAIL